METIAWIGFSLGLFTALLLIFKKNAAVYDKVLAAWLSLLAIEFLTLGIDFKIFGKPLLSSSFLLINPAFFFYVKSLIQPHFKIRAVQLLHLLPYITFESIAYLVNEPFSIQSFFDSRYTTFYGLSFITANLISWAFYNSYSTISVLTWPKKLENVLSNIETEAYLRWVRFIVIFYNLYCALVLISGLVVLIFRINFFLPQIFNYSALLALLFILGFYGLRQTTIFHKDVIIEIPAEKYMNSGLTAQKKEIIKTAVINHFRVNKPYIDPAFSMSHLSEQLKIPKHQLTEVLNAEMGRNFFRYVNEFRIEEVKLMLADEHNNFSIEDIGYECGFSSKSSFFTIFKKITGQTPLQFKNSVSS